MNLSAKDRCTCKIIHDRLVCSVSFSMFEKVHRLRLQRTLPFPSHKYKLPMLHNLFHLLLKRGVCHAGDEKAVFLTSTFAVLSNKHKTAVNYFLFAQLILESMGLNIVFGIALVLRILALVSKQGKLLVHLAVQRCSSHSLMWEK